MKQLVHKNKLVALLVFNRALLFNLSEHVTHSSLKEQLREIPIKKLTGNVSIKKLQDEWLKPATLL